MGGFMDAKNVRWQRISYRWFLCGGLCVFSSAVAAAGTAPTAPTGLSAKLGANNVSLSFTPPASTGSSAVALYTATCTC